MCRFWAVGLTGTQCSRPRWETRKVLYLQVISCVEDTRLLWYSELFVASLENYKNSLMREMQIYPFTGQVYGFTPAADIQTIGRKAIVHIKRWPPKSCLVKKKKHLTCHVTFRHRASTSIYTDMHACPQGVWTCEMQYFRAPVQSCVREEVYFPLKRTRSISKTHLNGMTGCWAGHLQQVLSAGNSMLWIMFTKQCEGPPYLHCWAESLRSGMVLWLFGIYLVIRPLKSNGGMKALALLNLLLLAYFV